MPDSNSVGVIYIKNHTPGPRHTAALLARIPLLLVDHRALVIVERAQRVVALGLASLAAERGLVVVAAIASAATFEAAAAATDVGLVVGLRRQVGRRLISSRGAKPNVKQIVRVNE